MPSLLRWRRRSKFSSSGHSIQKHIDFSIIIIITVARKQDGDSDDELVLVFSKLLVVRITKDSERNVRVGITTNWRTDSQHEEVKLNLNFENIYC